MNDVLTNAFRQIIIKEELIDTGLLRDTVVVSTNLAGPILMVDIDAQDYVKYHLEDRRLVQQWSDRTDVQEELERLLAPVIEEMFQSTLDGMNVDPTLLAVRVSVNGRAV